MRNQIRNSMPLKCNNQPIAYQRTLWLLDARRRLLSVFVNLSILAIVFVFALPSVSFAEEKTTEQPAANTSGSNVPIRISLIKDNAPFSFQLPNGEAAGLYVDIWREWSIITGRDVEFIQTELALTREQLENGTADIHSGLFKNDKRESWGSFSLPIDRINTTFFYRYGAEHISSFSQLSDKKLAVASGSYQENFVKRNYPHVKRVSFTDNKEILNRLLDGQVDAILAEIPTLHNMLSGMGLNGVLTHSDKVVFSNTVHALIPDKNAHLLAAINDGIRKFPVETIMNLEKKWLPSRSGFFETLSTAGLKTLTMEEQHWLSENHQLILGVDSNWKPFEYVNDKGEYAGIASEYVTKIAEMLSVTMIPETKISWATSIEKTKTGEIDLLPAVARTEERKNFLYFTDPYIEFTMVVVAQKNAEFILSMNGLQGKKIATVKGYKITGLLKQDYPDIELVMVKNTDEGIEMVESGDVYGFIENIAVVTHNINVNNRDNLTIALHTDYRGELSFGVRKGLEPLVPILNKALREISEKERSEILNRWLSVQINVGTDIVTILQWSIPGLLVLLSIIGFVARSNRRLQKEIILRKRSELFLTEARKIAEDAQAFAERANKSKNQFLANMSHEIRTPMNAMVGSAHLLTKTPINEEQRELVDVLNVSTETLLGLINDILDFSKVDAGKMELEQERFEIRLMVKNAVKQAELSLYHQVRSKKRKALPITHNIDSEVPVKLVGDRLRLSQVLLNLVNNAIKFTDDGVISVAVAVEYFDSERYCLHFVVTDTGIGMTLEQTERLFKTYNQADSSISRKYGGTGLGLAICKRLCQLMQGHIWVESEKGKGSQFHFTCMLNVVEEGGTDCDSRSVGTCDSQHKEARDSEAARDVVLQNCKILIVDDNEINLTIAQKILTNKKVTVDIVRSGAEALDKLAKTHFDCVLMDVQMPGMDGYQVTKAIRDGSDSATIPIIGLSANAMESDIKQGLAAGMNDYLSKPIDPERMFWAIVAQLHPKQSYGQTKEDGLKEIV